MKAIKIYIIILLSIFIIENATAQPLTCNAGNDTILCDFITGTDTYQLGGIVTASGGGGNYFYEWNFKYFHTYQGDTLFSLFGSSSLNDTSISNPILDTFATDSMLFILTVTDDSGNTCKDSVLIRYSDIISDFSSYTYYFEEASDDDSIQICGGLSSNIGPVSVFWSPNIEISDTSAYCPFVSPDATTCYSFKIIDGGGCEATQGDKYCFIKGSVGVEENFLEKIKIYPNPFSSRVEITLLDQDDNNKIELYDIIGNKIICDIIKNDVNNYTINTEQLKKGIYLLKINNEQSYQVKKILKK